MREFFHGWRRKAGCVALVVVCHLCLMWHRNSLYGDRLDVFGFVAISQLGSISINYQPGMWPAWPPSVHTYNLYQGETWQSPDGTLEVIKGFRHSHFKPEIPLWPTILTLSILSAYLILWPGKRVTKQAAKE